MVDAHPQRNERLERLRRRERSSPRTGEEDVRDPGRAVGGCHRHRSGVVRTGQQGDHRAQAVAEQGDRAGTARLEVIDGVPAVAGEFGKGPPPARAGTASVSPIVEAERVQAGRPQLDGQRLIFEGVKSQAAQQDHGGRGVAHAPEPTVQVEVIGPEAHDLGFSGHGRALVSPGAGDTSTGARAARWRTSPHQARERSATSRR